MDKKETILNLLDMKDVLTKYNFPIKGAMFNCPFHGKDKHPSAKYFDKSFYCFACNKNGDLIQFVQDHFNLGFKEAMEKLNQDFNLGIEKDYKVNIQKIQNIKNQRIQKQKEKEKLNKEFAKCCEKRWEYENKSEKINKEINCKNWVDKTKEQLSYRDLIAQIDNKLDIINKRIALL